VREWRWPRRLWNNAVAMLGPVLSRRPSIHERLSRKALT